MTAVYDGYLWKRGKLEMTAHDIVAESEAQAARRIVSALRSRPGKEHNPMLRDLGGYVYGFSLMCPEGVTLQVVERVRKPGGCPCVAFG